MSRRVVSATTQARRRRRARPRPGSRAGAAAGAVATGASSRELGLERRRQRGRRRRRQRGEVAERAVDARRRCHRHRPPAAFAAAASVSARLPEELAQRLVAAVRAHLHRADGGAGDLGRLGDALAVELGQHDRLALLRRAARRARRARPSRARDRRAARRGGPRPRRADRPATSGSSSPSPTRTIARLTWRASSMNVRCAIE